MSFAVLFALLPFYCSWPSSYTVTLCIYRSSPRQVPRRLARSPHRVAPNLLAIHSHDPVADKDPAACRRRAASVQANDDHFAFAIDLCIHVCMYICMYQALNISMYESGSRR